MRHFNFTFIIVLTTALVFAGNVTQAQQVGFNEGAGGISVPTSYGEFFLNVDEQPGYSVFSVSMMDPLTVYTATVATSNGVDYLALDFGDYGYLYYVIDPATGEAIHQLSLIASCEAILDSNLYLAVKEAYERVQVVNNNIAHYLSAFGAWGSLSEDCQEGIIRTWGRDHTPNQDGDCECHKLRDNDSGESYGITPATGGGCDQDCKDDGYDESCKAGTLTCG